MKIYNHISPKLSDLELKLIKYMPKENGSWRDLPESIIKLSKRLKNVKEKNNWG